MKNNQLKIIFSIALLGSLLTANLTQSAYFHPKTLECSTAKFEKKWVHSAKMLALAKVGKMAIYTSGFIALSFVRPAWAKKVFSNVWGGKHVAEFSSGLVKNSCKLLKGRNSTSSKTLSKLATNIKIATKGIEENYHAGHYGPITNICNNIFSPKKSYSELVTQVPNSNQANTIQLKKPVMYYSPIFGDFMETVKIKYKECDI
ncbi:hypothetical protein KAH94_03585 [bacterium]|nr:hypothetical protein [bacterium]